MERTPEETLKLLAMYYNEQYTAATNPAFNSFDRRRVVNVTHIKTENSRRLFTENDVPVKSPAWMGGFVYEVKRAHTIRASCCFTANQNEWIEIKWEGPLEEWYKALYEDIVSNTQPHLEDKIGRIERNQ